MSLKTTLNYLLTLAGLTVAAVLVWQGFTSAGAPDPTTPHIGFGAAVLDTAVLVFREGLETILVLAAVVAGFNGAKSGFKQPIAVGAAAAFAASVATWFAAVGILSDLSKNVSALALQAGTGLLAVVVLLVVMNWFFHKIYWTGWIAFHGRRKRNLVGSASAPLETAPTSSKLFWGMVLLGFTSVYREGFEVVLFLQGLRLQVGTPLVLEGLAIGLLLTAIVGVLTLWAHARLPHRKMLIWTGILLGVVLLVMVGEEAQEMQLAGWITTTNFDLAIPAWMGVWFSLFPTWETVGAQLLAAAVVLGSYFGGQYLMVWRKH